jgi:hypothetical protein
MTKDLFILWTNDNVITSEKMVLMYAHNAILKGWWENVTVIIWGATAKMVSENKGIQDKLKQMLKDGVHISACKACADQLGVSEILEDLGIELKYWGVPLTEVLMSDSKLITI